MSTSSKNSSSPSTRQNLVEAATTLIRRHGFSATTVDKICAEAGVTKGAFFHYFKSKDDLGETVIAEWCRFGAAMYHGFIGDTSDDPLVRLDRLFDGMIGLAERGDEPPVCLLGMIAQELSDTNQNIRSMCSQGFGLWTEMVADLVEEARKIHEVDTDFDPAQIGWLLNSLWQGSMLIAKTRQDCEIIVHTLRHARAYIKTLFPGAETTVPEPLKSTQ